MYRGVRRMMRSLDNGGYDSYEKATLSELDDRES